MKKLIFLTLIISLFSNFAHAEYYDGRYEAQEKYRKRIKDQRDIINKLNCTKYNEMPQKQANKCFAHSIELVIAALDYTDWVHVMLVDHLDISNGYVVKK